MKISKHRMLSPIKGILKWRLFILGLLLSNSHSVWSIDSLKVQYIDSVNQLSYSTRINTHEENLKTYLDLVALSKSIGYQKGIADAYANLSLIYFYHGDKGDESLYYLSNAVEIYEEIKAYNSMARLYGQYGYGLRHKDLKKAGFYLRKGIHLAEQEKARYELMGLYDNYGVILEQSNKVDSAEFYYQTALRMKIEMKDSIGIPYSLNKLGLLHLKMDRIPKAKELLDEAYSRRIVLLDSTGIAENVYFYGLLYQKMGEFNQAIDYFNQSIEVSKQVGVKSLIEKNLAALYQLYEEKNDYKNAFQYYKLYQQFKDSLYKTSMEENKAYLEVKFETAEKERDLLLHRAELAENKLELQRKNLWVLMLIISLVALGVISYFVWKQQKYRQHQLIKDQELQIALANVETQKQLERQRLKISRELHDNIGAQLTFIISSLDNITYFIQDEDKVISKKLTELSQFTQQTIMELRDTIWAMNHTELTIQDLIIRLRNLINMAGNNLPSINFEIIIEDETNLNSLELSSIEGMNLYRSIQESINNAIKHSKSTVIKIILTNGNINQERLKIIIQDNGVGFDHSKGTEGNGLVNIKKRMMEIDGNMKIISPLKGGTEIILQLF